jgi:hypothetical protein
MISDERKENLDIAKRVAINGGDEMPIRSSKAVVEDDTS